MVFEEIASKKLKDVLEDYLGIRKFKIIINDIEQDESISDKSLLDIQSSNYSAGSVGNSILDVDVIKIEVPKKDKEEVKLENVKDTKYDVLKCPKKHIL